MKDKTIEETEIDIFMVNGKYRTVNDLVEEEKNISEEELLKKFNSKEFKEKLKNFNFDNFFKTGKTDE